MNMRMLSLSLLLLVPGFVNGLGSGMPKINIPIKVEDLSTIKSMMSPQEQAMTRSDILERVARVKELEKIEFYPEWQSMLTAFSQSKKNYKKAFAQYIAEESAEIFNELEAALLTVIYVQNDLAAVENKIDDMKVLSIPSGLARLEVLNKK